VTSSTEPAVGLLKLEALEICSKPTWKIWGWWQPCLILILHKTRPMPFLRPVLPPRLNLLPIVPVQLAQIILHSIRQCWEEAPNKISSVLIHRRQLLLSQIKLSTLSTTLHRVFCLCSSSSNNYTHNQKICSISL
jgi:hypothetical protein